MTAEAFAERMLDILNSAALALMTSVGHRTRLFDTLAALPPSTSEQIARAARLDERYVREWLGAMVVGRIVEYDGDRQTYRLPAEHAASLTRAAVPNNIAAFAQYVGVLGAVEDRIVECFERGGGVPYSAFPRFQAVMAEDSGQTVVAALEEHILPLVPGLVQGLERGIDVLDIGCGSGRALTTMARAFPASRFVGYDLSEPGIAAAIADARAQALGNVRFAVQDVTALEERDTYNLVTAFDAIHDQARPLDVLKQVRQALRPDGTFLMQDIRSSTDLRRNLDHPVGPLLYALSCMHCMTVSLAQGGAGLGAMWGEERAREMLREAGFTTVEVKQLAHDFQNSYYLVRRDGARAGA